MKLSIKNKHGSAQHYFHFLLGFLIPLYEYYVKTQDQEIIVKDCGPMNRMINELLPHVTIGEFEYPDVSIHGYDWHDAYNYNVFSLFVNFVKTQSQFTYKTADIILIDRGFDPFYHSEKAEIPTSGNNRRSIINQKELYQSLCNKFPNTSIINIQLENLPLIEQCHMFSKCKLIIGQHGAGLANMIFMNPGMSVIELGANNKDAATKLLFSQLAKTMKIYYYHHQYLENYIRVDVKKTCDQVKFVFKKKTFI